MVDTSFCMKIKPPFVIESLILAKLSHVYVMPEGHQVLLQNRRWAHVCSRIIISGGHWMLRVEERDRWWYNILYLAWNSCHFWLMGAYSVRDGVLQFWNWFSILPTSTLTINMGRFNKLSPPTLKLGYMSSKPLLTGKLISKDPLKGLSVKNEDPQYQVQSTCLNTFSEYCECHNWRTLVAGLLDNITEPRLKAADGEIEMNGLQRASEWGRAA